MKSGNFGQDDKMNGMDQAKMGPERAAASDGMAERYDQYGHSAAWSVSDTIPPSPWSVSDTIPPSPWSVSDTIPPSPWSVSDTIPPSPWSVSDTTLSPIGLTTGPLAYYADAAADWLIEQPVFTTKIAKGHEETAQDKQPLFTVKEVKRMKETAGMGQPESGKDLSADWGGFTQIDSQAGGFENLRSSAKSADDDDLPVLPLAVFDPNRALVASYAMPMDPYGVIRGGDACVALMAGAGGLEFEAVGGGDIVSLTLAGEGEIVSLTLHAVSAGGGRTRAAFAGRVIFHRR